MEVWETEGLTEALGMEQGSRADMERWTRSDRREAEEFLIAPHPGRGGEEAFLQDSDGKTCRLEDAARAAGTASVLALLRCVSFTTGGADKF